MRFEDYLIGKRIEINERKMGKCIDATNIMYLGEVLEFEDGTIYILGQGDTLWITEVPTS